MTPLSFQVQAQLQLDSAVAHAHHHLHPHLAAHAPYMMSSARSPLHPSLGGSSPSPDILLSSSPALRSPAFSFDSSLVRRSPEEGVAACPAPRGRYRQLTNTSSQEALATPSPSPSRSCPSPDFSPVYLRRGRRPDSEGEEGPTRPKREGRGGG